MQQSGVDLLGHSGRKYQVRKVEFLRFMWENSKQAEVGISFHNPRVVIST